MKFSSCAEAYAAGYADIRQGSAHYSKRLDRDGDGVACEKENAPAGFVPGVGAYPPPAVDGKPLPAKPQTTTSTGTKTEAGADRLPQTGPGEITAIGLGLAAAGAATVLLIRRRRTRFTH